MLTVEIGLVHVIGLSVRLLTLLGRIVHSIVCSLHRTIFRHVVSHGIQASFECASPRLFAIGISAAAIESMSCLPTASATGALLVSLIRILIMASILVSVLILILIPILVLILMLVLILVLILVMVLILHLIAILVLLRVIISLPMVNFCHCMWLQLGFCLLGRLMR